MQNAHSVIYNHRCDGAWCSGSTWASDSHCVGSIPIAPANANTLLPKRVFSYIRHSACLHEKSGGYKKKVTRQRVCVGRKRSATEACRKTCITIPHRYPLRACTKRVADIRKKSRDSGFALGTNGAQRKHVARRALLYPTLSLRACTKRVADIRKKSRGSGFALSTNGAQR